MDDNEKQILQFFRSQFTGSVDPIVITDGLYRIGLLTDNQRKTIFDLSRKFQDRPNVWNVLFVLIQKTCKLRQLIKITFESGFVQLAIELSEKLRLATPKSNQVCRIYRTKTGYSDQRLAQKLFMNFKINTHNNAFLDPRKYVHDESLKYRIQLDRSGNVDEEIKRGIADKYAACLLAEIDSYIMLYSKSFPAQHLMKELKRLIPETSNSIVTEMSYESRLAMTCAVAGRDDESDEHLQVAIGASLLIDRCVEISNLFYIYVFNLLCRYEKCPTKAIRDQIIHIAELGLLSIDEEEETIREFWMRLFIVRIIYCLLALSYRGDPLYYITVEQHCIDKAKYLLSEMDKLWNKIESRRKIMYFVAKARIAELEKGFGYQETVRYFLQQAIDIGSEGEYGETQYVKLYASYFSALECFENSEKSNKSDKHFSIKNLEMNNETLHKCDCVDYRSLPMVSDIQVYNETEPKSSKSYEIGETNVKRTEFSEMTKSKVIDDVRTSSNEIKNTCDLEEEFGVLRLCSHDLNLRNQDANTILEALNINKAGNTCQEYVEKSKETHIKEYYNGSDIKTSVRQPYSLYSQSNTTETDQTNLKKLYSNSDDDITYTFPKKFEIDGEQTSLKKSFSEDTLIKTEIVETKEKELNTRVKEETSFESSAFHDIHEIKK